MLVQILEATRGRLAKLDRVQVEEEARASARPRSLTDALSRDGVAVIAEVKRRSPSAGPLAVRLDPGHQAEVYSHGGAAAISVLTEPMYFGGSLDDLRAVKSSCDLPVLRKDFIVDPIQVAEARAAGADAILLIVAALSDAQLDELLASASEWGLDAVVEVHTEREAKRAADSQARIVGVNNRDLANFTVDLAICERLARYIEGDRLKVAESGIHTSADSKRMSDAGYDAVLVGEALVTAQDPAALLRQLASD